MGGEASKSYDTMGSASPLGTGSSIVKRRARSSDRARSHICKLNTLPVQGCLKGARVLVLGVAYKKDVDDLRESPSLKTHDGHANGNILAYVSFVRLAFYGKIIAAITPDKPLPPEDGG